MKLVQLKMSAVEKIYKLTIYIPHRPTRRLVSWNSIVRFLKLYIYGSWNCIYTVHETVYIRFMKLYIYGSWNRIYTVHETVSIRIHEIVYIRSCIYTVPAGIILFKSADKINNTWYCEYHDNVNSSKQCKQRISSSWLHAHCLKFWYICRIQHI